MSNKYFALRETGQEPEYQKNSPLEISSVGTENTKSNVGRIPYGCALLTGTGGSTSGLRNQGIDYIIHATPMPEGDSKETFIEMAAKAIQNSIILADRFGIQTLATCLLGGKIYLKNPNDENSKKLLADGIIRAALNQMRVNPSLNLIYFVDFDGDYYQGAFDKIKLEIDYLLLSDKARVVRGDLCNRATHAGEAIVNSENPQMGWGSGISGEISTKLGTKASQEVDKERHELRDKFNSLIEEKEKTKSVTCRAKYKGPTVDLLDGSPCFSFEPQDGNKDKIAVSQKFPIFTDNPPKFDVLYEISLRIKEEVGGILKLVEIIKIEEIKNDDKVKCDECQKDLGKDFACGNPFNESKDLKLCSKCYSDLTILHGKFKGYEISRNGNSSIIVYDGKKTEKKDKESVANFQEELKKVDNSLEQVFADENKVKEWKKQGNLGKPKAVRNLLETVKNNSNFLNLIKNQQNSDSLEKFISNKVASEVITIVKRFEYDHLSQLDKEIKVKRMREHYSLGENDILTDSQINEYCYKLAIGQINENEQDQNTINPKNNILKYFGIGVLTLITLGLLLAFFIRKRKK